MKNYFEQEMICKLTPLVSELVELEDWPSVNLDGALLLYDFCRCLNLSNKTIFALLGNTTLHYLIEKGVIDKTVVSAFRI